jgi:hypothetical protein
LEAVGPFAIGLTLLDEQALVIDVSSQSHSEVFERIGITAKQGVAVDPFFAENLPADTLLMVQSTDLIGTIGSAVTNTLAAVGTFPAEADIDLEEIMGALAPIFGQLSELELGAGVFGGRASDYALFVTLNPALADVSSLDEALTTMPLDLGLVIETAGPSAARSLVTRFRETLLPLLEQLDVEGLGITFEQVGAEEVTLVILDTAPDRPFQIELLMGAKDELLVVGTRNAATAVMLPGESLADTDAYAEALEYKLLGANPFAYINPDALMPLLDLSEVVGSGPEAMDDVLLARSMIDLSESASMTAITVGERGYGVARFVLMLVGPQELAVVDYAK